jgi:peptidase E
MINVLLSRTILNAPWLYQSLKQYLKPQDRVLVVLYSFFSVYTGNQVMYDHYYQIGGEFDTKLKSQFLEYGIKDDQIEYLNYYHDKKTKREEKLKRATILFFPGGAPDEMKERLIDHELFERLKQFNGVVIGSSAGAMIQASRTHFYKDHEYKKFSYFYGLDYLKEFDFVVHYRRRIQQKKAIRRVFYDHQIPIYAIPDDGAIIVSNGHVSCLGTAHMLYDHKGRIK